MESQHGLDVIEPVELFLSQIIDPDRLLMYQEIIDQIKLQEKYSILDGVNSIVLNCDDESGSEIESLVYTSLCTHARDMLLEYSIVVVGGNLPFLTKFVKAVNLLDVFDQSETIINIANDHDNQPKYRLYQLISLIDEFDEEMYSGIVSMVSMSLLERIVDVHESKLLDAEDDTTDDENLSPVLIKKFAKENSGLILNKLVEQGQVKRFLPVKIITQLFCEEFDETGYTPTEIAKELIAAYSITGKQSEDLLNIIRELIPDVISDDNIATQTTVLLPGVYLGMTQ